jgi:hypothetical protein
MAESRIAAFRLLFQARASLYAAGKYDFRDAQVRASKHGLVQLIGQDAMQVPWEARHDWPPRYRNHRSRPYGADCQ